MDWQSPSGVSSKVLMPRLGCEGVLSLQLRCWWVELELGSAEFGGKSGTSMIMGQKTNGNIGWSLQTKIVGVILLGGGPWLLCRAYGSTLGWKDCK